MIARVATLDIDESVSVAKIDDEIAMRMSIAVSVVVDALDVQALDAIGFPSALAGRPGALVDHLSGCGITTVVLVGAVDPGVRELLQQDLPEVEIYSLSIGSPALAIGYTPGANWDAATIARKRETWGSLLRDARLVIAGDEPVTEQRRPFPVAALPRALRTMAEEGAAAQGADIGYWCVPMLGIIAGSIGATRRIALKSDWSEPAICWPALIAPSGSGKSVPLRELERPLRDVDYELHQQNEAARQAHEAELDNWKSLPADERGERPEPPALRAVMIADATLEAVIARHASNPRGLCCVVDELAGFVKNFDRYRSGGGDLQQWLSIYDGAAILVDRKGTANGAARTYIKRTAISITGTIQPGVARRHLGDAEKRDAGLAGRLLLASPPVTAARWTDRSVSPATRQEYGRIVRSLLDLRMTDDGDPVYIRVSDDALALFVAYHDQNGVDCVTASRAGDGDVAAALAKLRGAAARIALVLALARAAEDGVAATLFEIGEESMAGGIAIAKWFAEEARAIYAQWSAAAAEDQVDRDRDSLTTLAERLAGALREGPKDRESLRKVTHRNVPAPRIDAALAILRAGGKADCERRVGPNGGRPREIWRLNVQGVSA